VYVCCDACTRTLPRCPRSFFEDYKKNENKMVRVDDILGAAEAIKAVKDGLVRRGGGWCVCWG
jgi:inorganic pyrophosphatase